jgi:hypothetical protein
MFGHDAYPCIELGVGRVLIYAYDITDKWIKVYNW